MTTENALTEKHPDRELVCSVCGLRVLRWGSHGWKHAGGGAARSCGTPPVPSRITTKALYAEQATGQRRRHYTEGDA
jgi:hypothetical protein